MENWKDNNLSAILEYPFDFERYMEERLREIDDLDERKFAKKLLLEGLGKVIRCTEAKYQQLERRVYEELEIEDNRYEAVLTIVKRSHYDPTNGTLFPVSEEDLDEKILKETWSDGSRRWLGSIFLEASDDRQRDFQDRTKFTGTLVKAEENRAAAFEICRQCGTGRGWKGSIWYSRIIISHGIP